jgi:hypothetical protein
MTGMRKPWVNAIANRPIASISMTTPTPIFPDYTTGRICDSISKLDAK